MIVVKPIEITDSNLVSTIPEPDASVGEVEWTAGTYTLGQQVIKSSTHRLYQVVADPSTTDDPEVGVNASPATWVDVSGTNKYRMFDEIIGTQSTGAGPNGEIVVSITPGSILNALVALNIDGQEVNVTMVDPNAGEVYNEDIDLRDNSAVVDYYEYFFSPIIEKTEFGLTDLPAYPNATTTLTISAADDAAIGELVVGQQLFIGETQAGTKASLLNFNTLERDDFGNLRRTTGRTTADRFDFNIMFPATNFSYIRDQMRELNDIAAVWIGTTGQGDGTTVYGYYRDLEFNLDNPRDSVYTASFQVEGLI